MTDEEREALAEVLKTAHDTAPRREAWIAAARVVERELEGLRHYAAWLESRVDEPVDEIRAAYAASEG